MCVCGGGGGGGVGFGLVTDVFLVITQLPVCILRVVL